MRIATGNQYVTTNALHMAIVGGAIANDGTMMRPYLVREVRDSSCRPFLQNQPQPMARPTSPETAELLTAAMTDDPADPWQAPWAVPGVDAGCLSGSAHSRAGRTARLWIVCFAPVISPRVAPAALLLDAGPIASEVQAASLGWEIAHPILEASSAMPTS